MQVEARGQQQLTAWRAAVCSTAARGARRGSVANGYPAKQRVKCRSSGEKSDFNSEKVAKQRPVTGARPWGMHRQEVGADGNHEMSRSPLHSAFASFCCCLGRRLPSPASPLGPIVLPLLRCPAGASSATSDCQRFRWISKRQPPPFLLPRPTNASQPVSDHFRPFPSNTPASAKSLPSIPPSL